MTKPKNRRVINSSDYVLEDYFVLIAIRHWVNLDMILICFNVPLNT